MLGIGKLRGDLVGFEIGRREEQDFRIETDTPEYVYQRPTICLPPLPPHLTPSSLSQPKPKKSST